MKRIIALVITFVLSIGTACFAQGKISRQTKQDKQSNTHSTASRKFNASTHPKVSDPDGFINGHGYVDLGLPSGLKWATCNVGSQTPYEVGNYYAWGETYTKSFYDMNHYNFTNFKGFRENIASNPEYDAATKYWNKPWRMPMKEDFEELFQYCNIKWVNLEGFNGLLITRLNNKTIFLKAGGIQQKPEGEEVSHEFLNYWSGTPYDDYHSYNLDGYISYDIKGIASSKYKEYGGLIRPVTK